MGLWLKSMNPVCPVAQERLMTSSASARNVVRIWQRLQRSVCFSMLSQREVPAAAVQKSVEPRGQGASCLSSLAHRAPAMTFTLVLNISAWSLLTPLTERKTKNKMFEFQDPDCDHVITYEPYMVNICIFTTLFTQNTSCLIHPLTLAVIN